MRNDRWGLVLGAVGVVALSVAAWRRTLTQPSSDLPLTIAVSVLVVGAVVGFVALGARRDAARRRAAAAARPDWSTWAVWSDAGLAGELRRQGWHVERLRPSGGSRLTLAWSGTGVELWRGADVLVELDWGQVASVTTATGQAGGATRPAVCLTTDAGAQLVLVPTAKQEGGVAPASPRAVTALVERVRAVRDV